MRSDSEWEREVTLELQNYHDSVAAHPKFCDGLFARSTMVGTDRSLQNIKREIHIQKVRGDVRAETVLRCELIEAAYELSRGNYLECANELRECVAVINRMIDSVKEMSSARRKVVRR